MTLTTLTGLGLGLAFGGSVLLLAAAVMGWRPTTPPARAPRAAWGRAEPQRAAAAVGVGLVVAVLTRWPVAAGAAAAVVWLWPRMFGAGKDAASQLERLEALATWTESLRDSIAGSVGLEEAIRHSVSAAPPVLVPGLQRLVGRLRVQIPLPHALAAYAEEFEDSSADLVVAALILNSKLRGPGLVATLSALSPAVIVRPVGLLYVLSTAAREEIDMRRRIEEGRKSLRRTAMIIVSVTGLFAGGLTALSRDYVAPYSTPFGQIMLSVVIAVFAGGLMWIRSAANITPPERFLVGADDLDQALHPVGGGLLDGVRR